MIFLNPAVLFGLIAAAIPVLLHFLNLQKLKKIEFSTLAFLKELQKTKIRKLKFKQWLLLALRVLIILLLVSAFARPTLESVNLGGTSAAKTTSVYILDNSYSMSVVKNNGSYFNNAKQIIKNLIGQLQQGDEASLIFLSGKNNQKNSTTNLNQITTDLNFSNISAVVPDYKSAFSKANKILSESKNFNKEVYIFSDFQNSFNKLDDKTNPAKYFDKNTRIYLFDFANNGINNLSVTGFQLNNQILEVGKPINFTASVSNESGESAANRVASLFLNGVRSAQQSFNATEGDITSLSFEANLKESGLVEAELEIEDDDIKLDNQRYTAFYIPQNINVLILTDKPEDSRFVNLALQSFSKQSTLNINESPLANISSTQLDKNNAVIVIGSKNFRNKDVLKSFVKGGGNLIVFPGSESDLADFKNLLTTLGIPAPSSQIGKPSQLNSPTYFNKVEYNHPLFSNLFEDIKDTKVESPDIYSYFKINPSGVGRPIISLADNSLFLSEYLIGKGRVLLFDSAPLLTWNNFPVKSLFAPLINKIVLYQSLRNDYGNNIYAGDEINVNIENITLPQIKVIRPDGTDEFINVGELANKRFLNYYKTDEVGIYKFYTGEKLIDFASVNFDPAESNSKKLTEEQTIKLFKTIAPNSDNVFINPSSNYNKIIKQARFGTELWKYFLIAAMLLALIEMFISKSARSDLTEIKQNV